MVDPERGVGITLVVGVMSFQLFNVAEYDQMSLNETPSLERPFNNIRELFEQQLFYNIPPKMYM